MTRPLLLLLDLEGVLARRGTAIPEALALVREARRVCRVAVLTNASPAEVEWMGVTSEVDAVITPERIGAAKPSADAFRRALRVLQASPSTTMFCDDVQANVTAAAALGIDAVHTPDTPALERALVARGLRHDESTGLGRRGVGDGVGVGVGDESAGRNHPDPGEDARQISGHGLITLPDRADAEALAARLRAEGWAPCDLHSHRLAGDDDPEAVEWTILLTTAPGGAPTGSALAALEADVTALHGFIEPSTRDA